MGLGRARMNPIGRRPFYQRAKSIGGLAKGVNDTAQPADVRINYRVGDTYFCATAEADTVERAERHQQGALVPEADDFAHHLAIIASDQSASVTDRQGVADTFNLDHQSDNRRHPAVNAVIGEAFDFIDDVVSQILQTMLSDDDETHPARPCGQPEPRLVFCISMPNFIPR